MEENTSRPRTAVPDVCSLNRRHVPSTQISRGLSTRRDPLCPKQSPPSNGSHASLASKACNIIEATRTPVTIFPNSISGSTNQKALPAGSRLFRSLSRWRRKLGAAGGMGCGVGWKMDEHMEEGGRAEISAQRQLRADRQSIEGTAAARPAKSPANSPQPAYRPRYSTFTPKGKHLCHLDWKYVGTAKRSRNLKFESERRLLRSRGVAPVDRPVLRGAGHYAPPQCPGSFQPRPGSPSNVDAHPRRRSEITGFRVIAASSRGIREAASRRSPPTGGNLVYMSPAAAGSAKIPRWRNDIYSLGATLSRPTHG